MDNTINTITESVCVLEVKKKKKSKKIFPGLQFEGYRPLITLPRPAILQSMQAS